MSKWTRYFKGFKPTTNPAVVAGTQIQEKYTSSFLGSSMWTIAGDSGESGVNALSTVTIEGGDRYNYK